MLTVGSPRAPGILEHGRPCHQSARRNSRRYSSTTQGRPKRSESIVEINGVSIDRLTYINTALDALPGVTLREYFAPIMRFKKQMLRRQLNIRQRFPSRSTVEGAAAYTKMVADALTLLTRALNTAGGDLMLDGGTASLSLEPKDVIAILKDKVAPVSFDTGGVLVYPRESPDTSFVYIVVAGTVSATFFQPQTQSLALHHSHRGGGLGMSRGRKTYFTSANDVVRLCGGGLTQETVMIMDDCTTANSIHNNTMVSGTNANCDAPSVSNVTTAIHRSLRRASRTVGQPTLRPTHTEQVRGPVVLGASESLGMAPFKHVCYTASTTSVVAPASGTASAASKGDRGGAPYMEFVNAFCIRTSDVHAAVVSIAAQQRAGRQRRASHHRLSWCATAPGEALPRGAVRTVADFIVSARRRSLQSDYAATELLMRQSWLLQDAPAPTIRTLISHLVPRTYMPGEVMACPHTSGAARQLCFLRRGRLKVFVVPKSLDSSAMFMSGEFPNDLAASGTLSDGCRCWCLGERPNAQPAEVVESGASFGELSVLFREPRHCVLRADTVCDVWCLPHRSFTKVVHRDASLRDGLLQKAAVLRIEWMGKQRFTRALAQQLRAGFQLLRTLPDIAIRLIQERLEPVIYPPGSLVASTSTRCTEMIFIMRGTVSTICKGVATYGMGDVLGEGCLIPHRWPLGLSARTMVEGWRIKAVQVIDALRRMDLLHQYSGLVTGQTPQLMKKIFGTPLPEIEVDAVGRQRMPKMAAPPGGSSSYATYGRAVSEAQLKAMCFLYRDYVRWEDINYSTMGSPAAYAAPQLAEAPLDAVARVATISRLGRGGSQEVSAALSQRQDTVGNNKKTTFGIPDAAAAPGTTTAPLPGRTGTSPAVGSGRNAARANSGRRRLRPQLRVGGCRGPAQRVASLGAFFVKRTFFGAEAPSRTLAKGRTTHTNGSHSHPPFPPRLHRMLRLLDERNRTWAAEQYHEAALARQEMSQRDVALRDREVHLSRVSSRTPSPDSNGLRSAAAATARPLTATAVLSSTGPAPVHIFLQGERPKYELALSEAISIGYVMQLPGISDIQHSVLLVDPDVALGPPAQRGRRYLMSVTPNDRHTKNNFLFAASDLEGGDSVDSRQKAAETQAEGSRHSKTRKLFNMMRIAVAPRVDNDPDLASPMLHPATISGEFVSDEAPPPGTLVPVSESQVRGLHSEAEGQGNSILVSVATLSPDRADRQDVHLSNNSTLAHADSIATPSPLCVSPKKSRKEREEEAFYRLLRRDPGHAMEMLCKHYSVSCGFTSAGQAPTLTSPTWGAADGRSGNGADQMMSLMSISAESQRRAPPPQKLSLLKRLEAAARAGMPGASSTSGLESPALSRLQTSSRRLTDAEDRSVVLMNHATPSYPQLVRATARDRWRTLNQLTAGSAPPLTCGSSASLSPNKVTKANAASPSPTTTMAAPSAGLAEYFYGEGQRHSAPVLFVEGYGPLQPMPESWSEYPRAIPVNAVACGKLNVSNDSIDCIGKSGARASSLHTAMAAAAALRRRVSRAGGPRGSSRGGSVSASAHATDVYPQMEAFMMPNAEDTEEFIRHVQRDVEGLNAVAKEQRQERDEARAKNGHAGKFLDLVEATLGKPNGEELEFLEAWRIQYRHMDGEALRLACLPAPLRREAGPNYMVQELRSLANTPAIVDSAMQRNTSGVQEWQNQQASRTDGASLFPGASILAASAANASDGGIASALDMPQRVAAIIGTARLGFTPAPLQNPSAHMSPRDFEAWVRQREDFFAAYQRFLDCHGGDGENGGKADAPAPPLAVPKLQFSPSPPLRGQTTPPGTPAVSSSASSPEALNEPPADFRTTLHPLSEYSDAEEVFMADTGLGPKPDQPAARAAPLGSVCHSAPTSVAEVSTDIGSALGSLVTSPTRSSHMVLGVPHMTLAGTVSGHEYAEDANWSRGDEARREDTTTPPWLNM
ncbi:hypothetical protein JKF63_00566 [Porcisia hertigi]|uniref:Cyclic nucleotide-binding domain-containing protein n=1 Tax=Porcisia hertigi TaxID=2761500 RepID=A0A836KX71_9TRYP|nr:hypothetical protein JKF63_00566 [Porcisia hertigi]